MFTVSLQTQWYSRRQWLYDTTLVCEGRLHIRNWDLSETDGLRKTPHGKEFRVWRRRSRQKKLHMDLTHYEIEKFLVLTFVGSSYWNRRVSVPSLGWVRVNTRTHLIHAKVRGKAIDISSHYESSVSTALLVFVICYEDYGRDRVRFITY